jgi:hypothetical protein
MNRSIFASLLGGLALVLSAPVLGQPANDNCANAIPVADGTTSITNAAATQEVTIPCAAGVTAGASGLDVWYTYTASVTGLRNFETGLENGTSSVRGTLAIYDACGGNVLACDIWGGIRRGAKIYHFAVTAGTTYTIRYARSDGSTGADVLRISAPRTPVFLDDCEQAMPVVGQTAVPFSISQATLTNSDIQSWDCDVLLDAWYAWTPSITGVGVIDACAATNHDFMTMSIYRACGTPPLTCASNINDPTPPACVPKVCYDVVAGETYLVRIGVASNGYTAGASGNLNFVVRSPSTEYQPPADTTPEPGNCSDAPALDLNGGCDVTPNAFTTVSLCQARSGTASARLSPLLTVVEGLPQVQSVLSTDYDWYAFTLDTDQVITITGQSEFLPRREIRFGCPAAIISSPAIPSWRCGAAYDLGMTVGPLIAGTYYFAVGPNKFSNIATSYCGHNDRYWFKITGDAPCGGACCNGTTCSVGSQGACTGAYQGDGSACGTTGNPTTCCPANYDGISGLQIADIFAFLNSWFAGETRADFDHANGLQIADIFAFLNAWFSGC